MNCPGRDYCALQEHADYRNCSDGPGQCQELTNDREQMVRNQDKAGKALALAFMVLLTVACVWVGD